MRYIYYCVLAILCIGLVSACVVEEESVGSVDGQLVHKVFDATFEDSDMTTKTVLDETVGENGFRGLLWDSGDEIGVARYGGYYQKFTNVLGELSAIGVFDGYIDQTSQYYAIYPYTDNQEHGTSVSVTIPTVQTYRVNSFDRNMAPMVGKGNDGERLHFMNLCGVLAVQLTGSETIKSIVFQTKNGEKVSGICSVDPDYADYPVLDTSTATETYVTLDCGEGVQLSGEAVPFHIVLPPGVYEGFTLYITTADGKFMKKETSKTLTIKRSIVTKAASFDFENNVTEVTNLSEHGHSNCYVVPEAGIYSFDANIIGNGEFGLIEGAGFHTSNPSISPVSVELLWEDRSGLIKGYGYDPATGKCHLWASEQKGNALLAAKNSDGVILWSWHIWLTDSPDTQIYVKSDERSYTMLDRNLGATRADRGTGEQWKDAVGTMYQWGRKDPIAFDHNLNPLFTREGYTRQDVLNAISNPTYVTTYYDWSDNMNSSWWRSDKKTIYDPCPVGYRVPPVAVWDEFADSGETFDKGWDFNYDGTNTTYYPSTSVLGNFGDGYSLFRETNGDYWAAEYRNRLYFYYGSETDKSLFVGSEDSSYGFSVRCMKDEQHIDISTYIKMKDLWVSDITMNSVTVSSGFSYGSSLVISEKGFKISRSSSFSDEETVVCETSDNDFTHTFTNLDSDTKYYIKAYVIINEKLYCSNIRAILTTDSNLVTNLSKNGTANSYMISSAGIYSFNCNVQGNSNTLISGAHSAEVIWETKNTTESVNKGDIIYNVEFVNNEIRFEATGTYGNALIAIRDASGDILWNWHIWVSDYDPDLSYNTYISGAVMMDRNLGALDAGRTASAYGFLYQWGRKDPLISDHITTFPNNLRLYVNPETPYEYSIKNPTHSIGNIYNDSSSWGQTKTKYDPCPLGWKVPVGGPEGVWAGIEWSGIDGSSNSGSWTINEPYSVPAAIYPAPGYTVGNGYSLLWYGQALYCWSSTAINSSNSYAMHLFDRIERELNSSKKSEFSVRCMKDE